MVPRRSFCTPLGQDAVAVSRDRRRAVVVDGNDGLYSKHGQGGRFARLLSRQLAIHRGEVKRRSMPLQLQCGSNGHAREYRHFWFSFILSLLLLLLLFGTVPTLNVLTCTDSSTCVSRVPASVASLENR